MAETSLLNSKEPRKETSPPITRTTTNLASLPNREHQSTAPAQADQARHEPNPAIPSAQQLSRSCVEPGYNNPLLTSLEEIDQLEMEPAYQQDQGIAPSATLSRATSVAMESNRSTPVPRPVERLALPVLREGTIHPSTAESMTPTRNPQPVHNHLAGRQMSIDPSPHNQLAVRDRERSVDTDMPAQDELTTISAIFQGQWLLFVNAKENNNVHLMRIALNQAISTQDILENLFGTQRMMEIAEGWIAREELARLDQAIPTMERPQSTYQERLTHQSPLVPQALIPQHQQQLPPPPPPSDYRVMAPPIIPVQAPQNTGHRQDIFQPTAQRPYPPRQYYGQEHYYNQQQRPHQPIHHHHSPYTVPVGDQSNLPSQRNRRRRPDPMMRMMQMGSFFMRAERAMGRMQRLRSRGSHSNRGSGYPQVQPPPNDTP